MKPAARGRHHTCHHTLYLLTCDAFEELRAWAEYRCQICGLPEDETKVGYLGIDHDARRGNGRDHVRGLLCSKCNTGLRYVDDGTREPTPEQARYLANAWFWTHHPSPAPPGSVVSLPAVYARRPAGRVKVISTRIPECHYDPFTMAARMVGRSRAQLINDFIAWYLREPGASMPPRPGRARVQELCE